MDCRPSRNSRTKKYRKENGLRNIFITACYEVEERYSFEAETTKEEYKQLTMKCVDSFMRNLVDLDEVIVLTGKVQTYHRLFEDIYWNIKDIHKKYHPCNILWSDSDNICLKPMNIFGNKEQFAMFYSAGEHQFSFLNQTCLDLVRNLSPWMMANLRYYPATMDKELWEIGDDLAYSWIDEWAYETIIYNRMFHAQDIDDYNYFMRPEWNAQCDGPVGMISPEMVRDNVILHCHSTRGTGKALEKMDRALNFLKTM
jgi:hypothetical protein